MNEAKGVNPAAAMTESPPDPTPAPNPTPAAPAARRLHGWAALRFALRLGLLLVLAPLVFALIAGAMMIGHEITAPSWIKSQVEARAAAVLNGGSISFGEITVTVGTDMHPQIRLTDTLFRDASGTPIARVPQIQGQISPRGLLLRREVLVQTVRLTGAQIALRRSPYGAVAVAFDSSGAALGEAANFTALLDQIDGAFERPALEALERVTADGLIVNFDDARAGRSWTVDGGQLALDLRNRATRLTGNVALLSGRDYVTTLALSYQSPRGRHDAEMFIAVTDIAAVDIATQSPALSWLGELDATLSARLSAQIDEFGALGPLTASLEIGAGALQPNPGARPIGFDGASLALTFDPVTDEIKFDNIDVDSSWGNVRAQGHAYLRELRKGWPAALLGQFTFRDIAINPAGLYGAPQTFESASVGLRLRLDPFRLTVGQFTVIDGDQRLTGRADLSAGPRGWSVSVDSHAATLSLDRVMSLWPVSVRPKTRLWFADNLRTAHFSNVSGAFRLHPDRSADLGATLAFDGVDLHFMKTLPPLQDAAGMVTLLRNGVTIAVESGHVTAPQGGEVDMAGSVFAIPETRMREPPATIALRTDSTVTAALSLLDQPPFGYLTKAGLPVTLADGRVQATGSVTLPLKNQLGPGDVSYGFTARLRDLRSDQVVPGHSIVASELSLAADPSELRIEGPLRVGQVPFDASWVRPLGPDAGSSSRISATAELSQRFVDEFGIGLPVGTVSGSGNGSLQIDLVRDAAPSFLLSSALVGIGLRLPALGWSKGQSGSGRLEVAGVLGAVPRVDRLSVDAAGLTATGSISLNSGGGLDHARFTSVSLGGWFNAPVELTGRGQRQAAAITINGGSLDLRRANFGDSGGEGGPMTIALDRLQISDTLALTGFRGDFSGAGGFSGQFTAQVNGGTAVQGTVVPHGNRSAVRIVSADAGGVFRSAGLLTNANGGAMDLTLLPAGDEGNYDGTLAVSDLRVKDAPALAGLLDAISVVGLLQQLDGEGLSFGSVDASFRLTPDRIVVTQSSAVGAGLGVSMDGIYTLATKEMDFQGVISPFYLINGIGSVLTRRGEGLIGFNYTLRGPVSAPRVGVNPLSILTPGMFREIFRRPAPEVTQ